MQKSQHETEVMTNFTTVLWHSLMAYWTTKNVGRARSYPLVVDWIVLNVGRSEYDWLNKKMLWHFYSIHFLWTYYDR